MYCMCVLYVSMVLSSIAVLAAVLCMPKSSVPLVGSVCVCVCVCRKQCMQMYSMCVCVCNSDM